MNREILFRGKSYTDNKWHYGDYHYCVGTPFSPERHEITERSGLGYNCPPETIGQYTGLTDKNGKKIFEGDIVKTNKYGKDDGQGHNFAGPDTFEVVFEDGGYCLNNQWRRFNLRPDAGVEVIGNIYNNPERMGGEGDG